MSQQPPPTQNPESSPFPVGSFLPGGSQTDPPPNPATTGFKLNHLMLRIRSPARSLPFYINHLGLRTIFTMNTGPFTIYYLGYPPPNTNQDTLQSWAEETSNIHTLTQTLGLLELYHIHGSEKQVEEGGIEMSTGNQVPNLGFGHLGFTVPDVPATVERLRKDGVRIVKELGSIGRETVPLSQFEAERGVGVGEISEEYARFWRQIACVADPDGYIIELLPQNMQ